MIDNGFNLLNYKISERLSRDEIMRLFMEYRSGNFDARNTNIEQNISLVKYIVYKNSYYDKEELFSVGLIGLINAVDAFDYAKDLEFSTYALHIKIIIQLV